MPATTTPGSRAHLQARIARAMTVVVCTVLVAGIGACGSDVATNAGPPGSAARAASGATAPLPGGTVGSAPGTAPGTQPSSTVATVSTTSTPRTSATTRPAPTSTTAAPAAGRDLAVATTTVPLVDTSRPTISHGHQIAATRTLTTTVVYPSSGGPFPLIVFAHGYQLGPSNYGQIMRAFAAGGYVVAAPSFPLADAAVAGANLDRGDIPNQSGDLSFVITQLTGAAGSSGPLAGKIDGGRVGAVGHSDGADTVLDLGYYPGRMDARVQAIAALSPDAMTGSGGSVGSAPLLITHGDHDTIVPYANATTVFGQVHAHRFLMTLLGADHLPPVQGATPWAPVLDRVILDLLDHDVAGRTASDAPLTGDASVPGVSSIKQAG